MKITYNYHNGNISKIYPRYTKNRMGLVSPRNIPRINNYIKIIPETDLIDTINILGQYQGHIRVIP